MMLIVATNLFSPFIAYLSGPGRYEGFLDTNISLRSKKRSKKPLFYLYSQIAVAGY